jgi:hypothetical protein
VVCPGHDGYMVHSRSVAGPGFPAFSSTRLALDLGITG